MRTLVEIKVSEIDEIKSRIKYLESRQLKVRSTEAYNEFQTSIVNLHVELKIAAESLVRAVDTYLKIESEL